MWNVLFVVAVCLFGPAAATYGSDGTTITDEDCNNVTFGVWDLFPWFGG